MVGEEDRIITEPVLKTALGYIRDHSEIRDVLISGGDPLVMGTEKLERIIAALRAIPHVDIIRIGTRVPVVLPMRVTGELLAMLRKYHPIWINTHFTHPREITEDSARACAAIVDAGIPLGNQTVLLRGINDSADTLKALFLKLVHLRVRPYYLYQCDLSRGIGHFRTTVDEGIEIMHELTGNISGYAVPKYVIDAPGGGGRSPSITTMSSPRTIKRSSWRISAGRFTGTRSRPAGLPCRGRRTREGIQAFSAPWPVYFLMSRIPVRLGGDSYGFGGRGNQPPSLLSCRKLYLSPSRLRRQPPHQRGPRKKDSQKHA